jgi:4-hydroxy-3-polyprenylbenzoate decarboxylase
VSEKVSRRAFVAGTGAGLVVASCAKTPSTDSVATDTASTGPDSAPVTAPFDSLRDYIQAADQHGLVQRFDAIDQDAYEGTALMYRLVDRYGKDRAPVVMFERVKIGGRWIDGPIIANQARHVDLEALLFGLEPVPNDSPATFAKARVHLDALLEKAGGQYPTIEPTEIPRADAPCKQVTLTGDEIDITTWPFFQNNPGDSGRYINSTSVFTSDPEMGLNIGTYRCELKGPRHISVGTGEGQTGWRMLMAAKKRGEKTAPIALVLGMDPMLWLVSGTRIPEPRGAKSIDELATAGGLRGKPLEIVKCDTNDLRVPAFAEMVIEGEVRLESFESNGPYGEGYGYIGAARNAFTMHVTRITHRRNPWFVNNFTGVTESVSEMPLAALTVAAFRQFMPEITDFRFQDNVTFFSIRKTRPGQALEIGKRVTKLIPAFKTVMMVDDDVDLWNPADLFMAFATRWQPYPASHIFEDLPTLRLEPSAPVLARSAKIVIDATRQWPEEGGPQTYPAYSRQVLEKHAPDIFDQVDAKWGTVISGILVSDTK